MRNDYLNRDQMRNNQRLRASPSVMSKRAASKRAVIVMSRADAARPARDLKLSTTPPQPRPQHPRPLIDRQIQPKQTPRSALNTLTSSAHPRTAPRRRNAHSRVRNVSGEEAKGCADLRGRRLRRQHGVQGCAGLDSAGAVGQEHDGAVGEG